MRQSISRRILGFGLIALSMVMLSNFSQAAPTRHHNDGKQLAAAALQADGRHEIHRKGKFHTEVEVKKGKIASLHVRHEVKGEVSVRKYKTHKKMAQLPGTFMHAAYQLAQDQYLGTEYVGYAYTDEEGNEEYYWFPVDMILDGDTGAVEYVPET